MPTESPEGVPAGQSTRHTTWQTWLVRAVAAAGVLAVAWVCATTWDVVVHGHPAYAVLLAVTLAGSVVVGWRTRRARPAGTRRRRVARLVLVALGILWVAAVVWLRPFAAVQPALDAMRSGDGVTVTETATRYVLAPTGDASATGVFFQPGARVDARAYAAVLRPLAEAGHTVVVTKQPLGIAFLARGAFDGARADFPQVDGWVVGGHSLGGTVAATEADGSDEDRASPAVGLLLYGSYPADDVSRTLTAAVESVSGTKDGLSAPEKIDTSRARLPAGSTFTVVEGGSHAQFGDYGPQPGDGVPTISDDDARAQIAAVSVRFVDGLAG